MKVSTPYLKELKIEPLAFELEFIFLPTIFELDDE